MKINELLRQKREEVLKLAHQHGASRVRVFGSVAKGEETEASDLDLLVEMEPERSLLDMVAIKQDLEDLLGCRVHVVTEATVSPYLREKVLQEAVHL
ncbi:MAG: nucleotidyltransferase family protein [Syntrophales bacterium]|nr:nucleotidyltransferase family protein [Syntrophales bacterium]